MEDDKRVYGYVNGKPAYSADEYVYAIRGFEELKSDKELLDYAEKVTHHWYDAGHRHKFITFFLSDYALSEPYRSLTKKEFERLKELQKQARDEWEAEQAQYKYELYEGRPLTESEIRKFLDRHVETVKEQWGENNYYTERAEEFRDKTISDFRQGKVVMVDSYDFTAAYGNGTGSFSKELWSDGTIREGCYGYLD